MRSLLPLFLLATACTTTGSAPQVVDADPATREALFSVVASLEGRWQGEGPDGQPATTVFEVSSAGHAVRELMMEGGDHEMTNMYTLDGNELVMTHYCAGGNQPSMRATGFTDGKLAFRFAGVRDLKAADEIYMGEMTLVVVDEDHVEQHWRAFKEGELEQEMTIPLTRVR